MGKTLKGNLGIKSVYTALKAVIRRKAPTVRLTGPFVSWEKAAKISTGYSTKTIIDHVLDSALRAQKESLFEKDSVLVGATERSWPLSAGLLYSCAVKGRHIRVLDFGGSLGSTYFHNQDLLEPLVANWSVVEQENFVNAGKKHFESGNLSFFRTIEESAKHTSPDLVLLSSVFQYLEKPFETLQELIATNAEFLIVDRTPFHSGSDDLIMIQEVPKSIYHASYPTWVFSRENFLRTLLDDFELVSSLPSPEGTFFSGKHEITFEGFVFRRRGQ